VSAPPARQGPSPDLLALGAAALLCVALYFAVASENREAYRARPLTYNYYNLLADAFRSGRLDIVLPPDPEPWKDPMRYTPRVHDVSLYHGKYYLYFGAVPAAVLFLPWRLLTGSDLPQYWAGALFASLGYLFTVALLGRVKRDCLPWLSPGLLFASALILGLVTWWPLLLSRVGVWETCISSAYCFSCLALLCLYNGMRLARRVLPLHGPGHRLAPQLFLRGRGPAGAARARMARGPGRPGPGLAPEAFRGHSPHRVRRGPRGPL
jgi:hypothetical protein